MIESPDFHDPVHGIPVFSLYGEVRRPTDAMMDAFDVLLVDLQDLGCRIYTFITTLRYVLEAAAQHRKAVWVLDRPNPVGRPVEGLTLREGWESFVGAGPLPMRHGLTLGELGLVVRQDTQARCGVPRHRDAGLAARRRARLRLAARRARLGQSRVPTRPICAMARAYAGTVMLEGTTLSEGRGTTRPLELFGAPDIDARARDHGDAARSRRTGSAAAACATAGSSRPSTSTPASSAAAYRSTPRVPATTTRRSSPGASRRCLQGDPPRSIRDYPLWRDFPYEYEHGSSPSTSSTAARCCASGSTIRRRRRPIWMRWPRRTSRRG